MISWLKINFFYVEIVEKRVCILFDLLDKEND